MAGVLNLKTEPEDVHPCNTLIIHLVFPYLNLKDLTMASMVCKDWNIMSKDSLLWKRVQLENIMIFDWYKFVNAINKNNTIILDTKYMIIPTNVQNRRLFWDNFSIAILNAHKLKQLYLNKCPPYVLETVTLALPKLEIIEALLVKHCPELTITNVDKLTNLTELRIKGLSKIVIESMPSFENLFNLKILAITSLRTICYKMCRSLSTVNTNLVHLEIGECRYIYKDFAAVLRRFVNLTLLRLETFTTASPIVIKDVFNSIISLRYLTKLQLVNIIFNMTVKHELEKCDHIKQLFIIPKYLDYKSTTYHSLIHCFMNLSHTLSVLVWAIPNEILYDINKVLDVPDVHENTELNHISLHVNTLDLLRGNTQISEYVDEATANHFINLISIPSLKIMLKTMMPNVEIFLYKIPIESVNDVYLK